MLEQALQCFDLQVAGLTLNFIAAILLGFSTQKGLSVGYGGPIVWKKSAWQIINVVGWLLLAIGFLLQVIA